MHFSGLDETEVGRKENVFVSAESIHIVRLMVFRFVMFASSMCDTVSVRDANCQMQPSRMQVYLSF